MKKLVGTLLVAGLLSGCFVRTKNGNGNSARRSSTSCPPSEHWNGHSCVHNGRAKGHDKKKR